MAPSRWWTSPAGRCCARSGWGPIRWLWSPPGRMPTSCTWTAGWCASTPRGRSWPRLSPMRRMRAGSHGIACAIVSTSAARLAASRCWTRRRCRPWGGWRCPAQPMAWRSTPAPAGSMSWMPSATGCMWSSRTAAGTARSSCPLKMSRTAAWASPSGITGWRSPAMPRAACCLWLTPPAPTASPRCPFPLRRRGRLRPLPRRRGRLHPPLHQRLRRRRRRLIRLHRRRRSHRHPHQRLRRRRR